MNITLIDNTRKRYYSFVPLALLRLSAKHKNAGDSVELISAGRLPRHDPDIIYFSFIFLFNYLIDVRWILTYRKRYPAADIIIGGIAPTLIKEKYQKHLTGNKVKIYSGRDLALEDLKPDFDITGLDYSYGFTSRGCPNTCDWCVVPKLEGRQNIVGNWQDQIDTSKKIFYGFDNNVLATGSAHFESVLEFCNGHGIKVDFNQGMDAEILHKNKKIQAAFLKYPGIWQIMRFAWDSDRVKESIIFTMDFLHLNKIGAKYKSLLMLYDADDAPEIVFERIKIVLAHPYGFEIKLMRFKDLETGLLLRKWGGVGDLFADALGYAVTGVISGGEFWDYMFSTNLQDFVNRATQIRDYNRLTKSKVTKDFIRFAEKRISGKTHKRKNAKC